MEIIHDIENQKFYAVIEDSEAYLQYFFTDSGTMNMIKTYVPNNLRGQGIAGKIVEAGLIYAEKNNLKVIPSCSYVETYIERHPEFKKLSSL